MAKTTPPKVRKKHNPKLPLNLTGRRGWHLAASLVAGYLVYQLITLQPATSLTVFPPALLAGFITAGVIFFALTQNRKNQGFLNIIAEIKIRQQQQARQILRNRNDMLSLRKSLADITTRMEQEAQALGRSHTMESQLLHSLITQLSRLNRAQDPLPLRNKNAMRSHRIEMQMLPPPANPAPVTALDQALNTDIAGLDENKIRKYIRSAVSADKIELFMQPVVRLPQRQAGIYEIFARIPASPGTWLSAPHYRAVAQKYALNTAIDTLLLARCLSLLAEAPHSTSSYMINATGKLLKNMGFMGALTRFLSRHRTLAPRLIFELPQADIKSQDKELLQIIHGLSQLGCRFSLDNIRTRTLDIDLLKNWHIRYIKLDATWLVREARTENGLMNLQRLKKKLDQAGIDLIAEKIEAEPLLKELYDFNIDYGQGYLFGKPDLAATYQKPAKAA